MPFKSKAQQRFMFAAESRGDVPKGTAKHWAAVTPSIKKLPEKVKRKKHAEVPFLLELPSPDDPRISSYQENPRDLAITFRNHGFPKKAESDDIESIKPMVPAFPMPPKKLPKAIKQRRFEKSKRRKVKTAMQIVDEVFSKVAARMRKTADGEDGSEYIDPEEVYEFLRNNARPSDEKVHDWADYNDYDKEKVEEMIYRIAAKNASELIPGGKAEGKPATDYPSGQIQKGIQVEKEHTPNPAMAKEISKDHLEEFPNYYTELGKMEDKMKKSAGAITRMLLKEAEITDEDIRRGLLGEGSSREITQQEIDDAQRETGREVGRIAGGYGALGGGALGLLGGGAYSLSDALVPAVVNSVFGERTFRKAYGEALRNIGAKRILARLGIGGFVGGAALGGLGYLLGRSAGRTSGSLLGEVARAGNIPDDPRYDILREEEISGENFV